MTRATLILTALLFCLPCVPRNASAGEEKGDKVELRLRFIEGQQLTLTTTAEQIATYTWNDQDHESEQTSSMTTALKVLSLDDDGTATIEVTIEAVVLKVDMGRWSFEYHSTDPPDEIPRLAAPFAAVVGKTYTMKVTPGGDVPTLEGADTLLKAAQEAIPEDGRGRLWDRNQVTRFFSEDAFRLDAEAAFGFLPGEPVAVGDSWARTINVDRGMPLRAQETYTLAGREDGTATITLEAKLSPREEDEDEHEAEDGPRVTYDVAGTEKGTLTVDEETGCIFKIVITQELKGDMITSGFLGDDAERSTPVASETTITIETQEQQPAASGEDVPNFE